VEIADCHLTKGFVLRQAPKDTFRILAVCTGNVCRSPAVERLLANQLGPMVSVSSAGTHALVGHPISEPMATLLRQRGIEAEPFKARLVSVQMLKEADLILSMTRAQRGLIVELWPAAVRRAFTLREFARLLTLVDPSTLPPGTLLDRLPKAIPLAAAERGRSPVAPEEDDVVDPFRLADDVYAKSFEQMRSAIDRVVSRLL
jgi:low molecular weight protein-tyrosine phosphatase